MARAFAVTALLVAAAVGLRHLGWWLRDRRSAPVAEFQPLEGQSSSSEKCPTCGTTRIAFDPPLVFDASEACGAVKPGNWTTSYVPTCELARGHEGEHVHLVERTETW